MPEHGGLGGQGDLSSIGLSADQRGNAGGCVPHVEVLAGVEARPRNRGLPLGAGDRGAKSRGPPVIVVGCGVAEEPGSTAVARLVLAGWSAQVDPR